MKQLSWLIQKNKEFYSGDIKRIKRINQRVLMAITPGYTLAMYLFTIFAIFAGNSVMLDHIFITFDVLMSILAAIIFFNRKSENYIYYSIIKVLYIIIGLAFFILESVFPYPDKQSIFFCFPVILTVMVFAFPPLRAFLILGGYVSLYLLLAYFFKDRSLFMVEVSIAMGTIITGTLGYLITSFLRFDSNAAYLEMKYLGQTDMLTGLDNKLSFERKCAEFNKLFPLKQSSLIFIDVDGFKKVNDTYGHLVGDVFLKEMGLVLTKIFKEPNIVARFGGDEFVILITNEIGKKATQKLMSDLTAEMRNISVKMKMEPVSCCAGIAVKNKNEHYASQLERADAALYIAKGLGHKRVIFA